MPLREGRVEAEVETLQLWVARTPLVKGMQVLQTSRPITRVPVAAVRVAAVG